MDKKTESRNFVPHGVSDGSAELKDFATKCFPVLATFKPALSDIS